MKERLVAHTSFLVWFLIGKKKQSRSKSFWVDFYAMCSEMQSLVFEETPPSGSDR
jgi:hypothetical protein